MGTVAEATTFIKDLYGDPVPGNLLAALWRKSDRTTHYVRKASDAEAFAAKSNIYIGASLVPRDRGAHLRIKASDAAGIPGVWADIDMPGPEDPPDKRPAPNRDAAYGVANAILTPTVIVNSGYGLQAWWLFEEPWIFENDAERSQAARITRGWQTILRQNAQQHGFSLDSTFDLARLMRLPGTVNDKGGEQAPVEIAEDDGPRYTLQELAEPALAAAPKATETKPIQLSLESMQVPFEKFDGLCQNSDTFKKTWEHSRRDRATEGWSMSEWDLSLATQAIHANWENDEVAALVVAHRKKHGDADNKAGRKDYLERTIAKARSDISRDHRKEVQEQALEELSRASENGTDADKRMALFNTVLSGGLEGAPVVKELVQYNDDPDEARYVFVLVDGREVNIGRYENLREPRKLDRRLGPATQFVMETVKDDDRWREGLRSLLEVCQVRQSESEERALDWVRQYTADLLGAKREIAARTGHPFEEEDFVYVKAAGLTSYVRTVMRLNLAHADLIPLLRRAGFELRRVTYEKKSGDAGEATYWRVGKDEIE